MLDPATARLCVWRLPLEAAFRLFSKLGSLGGSIRERFSRTGRTRPALARPAFSRWLLENDRLRERWPCQWLNVLYFPFSETSPSRSISASVGRVATAVNSGFANVARQRCACHRQKRVIPKNLGQLALRNQPSSPLCACLRRPKRVLYLCSCGWISYPRLPAPCGFLKTSTTRRQR